MSTKRSIKSIARRAKSEDQRARAKIAKVKDATANVTDSFVNFAFKLGIGSDNPTTSAGYGFNPITRIRTLLEWVHRGSWIGGVAIDAKADDMTRAGVELQGQIAPDAIAKIEERAVTLGVWSSINEWKKWGSLYGGAIAVMMIDGQDFKTPFRLETVGKNQFKGLLVLDRWMVDPSLSDLVTEIGPNLGLPKYYTVITDSPSIPRVKIHYTRCFRMVGIQLPYWQRVMENLWGISVLERVYDRMVAFDSATTGASQLVYKAYLRTYKIKGLREIVASGGPPLDGLTRYVDMMTRFASIEGMTLIDGEDTLEAMQHSAFSGLSDALIQFGQQLSGALQIPLVRLFGQSPAGLNATGESDLRMYYDGIKHDQEKEFRVPVTVIYRALAQSVGVSLPDGFRLDFRNLWQLTDEQKATISNTVTDAVTKAEEAGLITQKGAMQELKQSSQVTGVFSNITDEDIEAADDELPPTGEEAMAVGGESGEAGPKVRPSQGQGAEERKFAAGDSAISSTSGMKRLHGLDIVIENPKDSIRSGDGWQAQMPADYGYIRRTVGADDDPVDCYVGPDHDSEDVWVIDQVDPATRKFDEHKVMLGYRDITAALADYVAGYSDDSAWNRMGAVRGMSMRDFKLWLGGSQS